VKLELLERQVVEVPEQVLFFPRQELGLVPRAFGKGICGFEGIKLADSHARLEVFARQGTFRIKTPGRSDSRQVLCESTVAT
jgi:hypothetical protein